MFLGCSLLVSGFLVPLFVPFGPRSRPPRHAKTRPLRPCIPPSARAPVRYSHPASRQPTVGTLNVDGGGLVKVTRTATAIITHVAKARALSSFAAASLHAYHNA